MSEGLVREGQRAFGYAAADFFAGDAPVDVTRSAADRPNNIKGISGGSVVDFLPCMRLCFVSVNFREVIHAESTLYSSAICYFVQ
jgi:hypothetical protein